MRHSWAIDRRTALRGLGTAISLPFLDVMLPGVAAAASTSPSTNPGGPTRMAFVYIPNGAHMPDWTPTTEGADYELPPTLQPLANLKSEFNVLSGLQQRNAFANGDGPGDHARALATFLTGKQARKTSGADISVGVSVDQVAAEVLGRNTRLRSLELGCDPGMMAGSCDSGYSCAYSANMSWKTPTTPMAKEIDPRLVFERLFSTGRPRESAEARARRERYQKSVLDFVRDDASRLNKTLGSSDKRKLDEYLTALRELERRIALAAKGEDAVPENLALPFARPEGVPQDYAEHIRLLNDLMVLAFQADLTRVATFVYANEGSNRSYAFMDVPEGHHDLSHHGKDKDKQARISKINLFHMQQFAHLLERLKSVQDGEKTLLDRCMIVYGSGIGDGDRHNHDDLPILLAGRGNGTIETGRHLVYESKTPLCNLFVSMLRRVGVRKDEFGDSTGTLPKLS